MPWPGSFSGNTVLPVDRGGLGVSRGLFLGWPGAQGTVRASASWRRCGGSGKGRLTWCRRPAAAPEVGCLLGVVRGLKQEMWGHCLCVVPARAIWSDRTHKTEKELAFIKMLSCEKLTKRLILYLNYFSFYNLPHFSVPGCL